MSNVHPILCVIPARGGSKGLPGKNIRPLAGMPLIWHTIACAKLCDSIARTVVSTDSEGIAQVARDAGADVPFLRPAELAQDDTPMWPTLQHALETVERDGIRYESLLLLDPTSPGRLPSDIERAVTMLESDPDADGVVGVSEPDFNPLWHSVVEENGYMASLFPAEAQSSTRQELKRVLRINATLYLWRRELFLRGDVHWRSANNLMCEVSDERAVHIDTPEQFDRVEGLLRCGMLQFPWLEDNRAGNR